MTQQVKQPPTEKPTRNWTAVSVIASTVIAVLGWWIVGVQNAKRDLETKRREIRVQYLISAYRQIESATNRTLNDFKDEEQMRCKRNLEDGLGDIQLFGSEDQIGRAQDIAKSLVSTKSVSAGVLDGLLSSLRNDLRDELDLPQTNQKLVHLRINAKIPTSPSSSEK